MASSKSEQHCSGGDRASRGRPSQVAVSHAAARDAPLRPTRLQHWARPSNNGAPPGPAHVIEPEQQQQWSVVLPSLAEWPRVHAEARLSTERERNTGGVAGTWLVSSSGAGAPHSRQHMWHSRLGLNRRGPYAFSSAFFRIFSATSLLSIATSASKRSLRGFVSGGRPCSQMSSIR